jgi:hypothetical protein
LLTAPGRLPKPVSRNTVSTSRARDDVALKSLKPKGKPYKVSQGVSPAIEKQRDKRRLNEAKSFGEFGEKWLTYHRRIVDALYCQPEPGRQLAEWLQRSASQLSQVKTAAVQRPSST